MELKKKTLYHNSKTLTPCQVNQLDTFPVPVIVVGTTILSISSVFFSVPPSDTENDRRDARRCHTTARYYAVIVLVKLTFQGKTGTGSEVVTDSICTRAPFHTLLVVFFFVRVLVGFVFVLKCVNTVSGFGRAENLFIDLIQKLGGWNNRLGDPLRSHPNPTIK